MGGLAHAGRRIPLEEGLALGTRILESLTRAEAISRGEICGSLRRQRPDAGDIDLVVVPGNDFFLGAWMTETFGLQKDGKTPAHSGLIEGVQVDVLLATDESWGAALMHCTGSKHRNVVHRAAAKKKGYLLNEKGLWKGTERVAGATEREVYDLLEFTWREPPDRE